MNTKVYCDIADLKLIRKYNNLDLVKGFTTNPSLMRKAGAKNYEIYSKEIIKICNKKPVSLEVFSDDDLSMINQARKINSWGKDIYVKVPVMNSKGQFTSRVIKKLSSEKIKLNITAVYSASQTKRILGLVNKNSDLIISIFAGRAGDAGLDPIPEFKKSIKYAKSYKKVKILWASVREPYNLTQAKQLGCHLITIPPAIIDKVLKFGKKHNQLSLETIKLFLEDSRKSKFKI